MDDAMQLLDTCFPGVLQEEGRGQELHLMLKRGKFIEMMREYCDKPTQFNNKATIHKPKKKSRYDNTDMMEVDGQTNDLLNRIMQYGKILREEYRYNTQEKSLVVCKFMLVSLLFTHRKVLGNILFISIPRSVLEPSGIFNGYFEKRYTCYRSKCCNSR